MIRFIDNLKYDTSKAEKIYERVDIYPVRSPLEPKDMAEAHVFKIYKTSKNNWFYTQEVYTSLEIDVDYSIEELESLPIKPIEEILNAYSLEQASNALAKYGQEESLKKYFDLEDA